MADWIIYDTQDTGTDAGPIKLFANVKDTDGEYVTNLSEANKLQYDFQVHSIGIRLGSALTAADFKELLDGAVLKMTMGDTEETILVGPLFEFLDDVQIKAIDTAYDTDEHTAFKPSGPFTFREPITIRANVKFNVDIVLESAQAAGSDIICTMRGIR